MENGFGDRRLSGYLTNLTIPETHLKMEGENPLDYSIIYNENCSLLFTNLPGT